MSAKSVKSWDQICLAVEKIIDGKTVTTEQGKTTTERKFRFSDFAREIGYDVSQAHRCVRGDQLPTQPIEMAIREWVANNNGK